MRNQDPPLNWTTVVRRGRGTRGSQMSTKRGVLRVPEPRPPPTVPSNAPSLEQWEAHWPVLASGGDSQAAGESEDRPDDSTQQQRGDPSRSAHFQASNASAGHALDSAQDADTCGTIKFPLSYICDDGFESCVDQTNGPSALESSCRQRQIRMEPLLFPQRDEAASPNLLPKARPEERAAGQMPSELATRLAARNDFRRLILEVEEALEEKKQIDRTSKELLLKRYEAASRLKQLEQQRLQDELNQPQDNGESTSSPPPGPGQESRVDQPQQHAGVGAIGNLLSQAHIQTQALMQTLPQLLKRLRHAISKSVIFVDPATYQDALHMEEELEKAVSESRQTQRVSRNAGGGPQQQASSRRGHREQQQFVQSAASSVGEQFPRYLHQRHAIQHQGGDEQHRRAHLQQPYARPTVHYSGSCGYPDPRLQAAYRNESRVIGEAMFVPAQQVEPPDMRAVFWESVARARGNDVPPPRAKTAFNRGPPHDRAPQQHAVHQLVTGQAPYSHPASTWESPSFNLPSQQQPAQVTPVHFGTVEHQQSCHQNASETGPQQPQGTRLQSNSKRAKERHSLQPEKQQHTLIDQLDFLSSQRSDPQQNNEPSFDEQQDKDAELEEWHEKWHEDPPPILSIQLRHNENTWKCRNPQEAANPVHEEPLSAVDMPAQTAPPTSQLGDSPDECVPSVLLGRQLRLHEVLKNQLALPLREDSTSPPHPVKWSSEWPMEIEEEKGNKPLQFKSAKTQSTRLDADGYVPFAEWYSNYFPEWARASPAKDDANACCDATPLDRLSMTDTQPHEADEPNSPHAESRYKALCPWGSDEMAKQRGPLEKLRDLIHRRVCSEEADEVDAPGGMEWLKRLQSRTEPFSFFGPALREEATPSQPKCKASRQRKYSPRAILEKHPFFQPLEGQLRGATSAREPLIAGAAAAQRILGDDTKSTAQLIVDCLVFIANNHRPTAK
ncbi:hypothetical protein Esti_004351 [Eimeria stiedai]